jgi:hypothetical protein
MTGEEMDAYVSEGAGEEEEPGEPGGEAGEAANAGGESARASAGLRCVRYELAPGVELRVDEDAPAASRAVVEELLRVAKGGGGSLR